MSSTKEYLLKKYGVEVKGMKKDLKDPEKKKKKKKDGAKPPTGVGVGMVMVDQDVDDWKTQGQEKEDDEKSEVYKMMIKEFQKNQEGTQNLEELEDELEGAQIVELQVKKRNDSQWESFEIGEPKRGRSPSPRAARHDSPDASPPRRRHDSPDLSPARKRHDSPDLSPPRKRHDSPDLSPPRKRHDSPDLSPPRKPSSGDLSPPRRNGGTEDLSPPRKRARSESPPPQDVKGRFATTIYRDKQGKKVDVKLERLKAEEEQKKKEEAAERHMAWGKGLVQKKEAEDRLKNLREIAAQPFATYKKDLARDEGIKAQERWGDPMAGLVSSKKKEEQQSKPKYKGPPPPPNRFDIPPGHRWDGVDRSNGYEKKLLMRESNRDAQREEAYRWSVSDM